MDTLNLPRYAINVKQMNGQQVIFDVLRQKHVSLTPEEWVRQHFVHYLMEHKGYPSALLQNEVELRCGQKRLRCDSVLYSRNGQPRMIIEYKAPSVSITPKVFDQIAAYNFILQADYLIVSNGINHYCCKMDYANNTYIFLEEIPDYGEL